MQFNATDMYPNIATVITTAIFPQFWGHLLKNDPMFSSAQNCALQNCGVNITQPKTRLITSPQN